MIWAIAYGGLFLYCVILAVLVVYEVYLFFLTDEDTDDLNKLTWMLFAGLWLYLIALYLLAPVLD